MTGVDGLHPVRIDRGMKLRQAVSEFGLPNRIATSYNVDYSRQYDEGGAGLFGTIAGVGKGVVEGALGLARGVQWLTDLGRPDAIKSENLFGKIPTDLRDALPQDYRLRLESRLAQAGGARKLAEVAGDVIPLVASGGTTGITKVAGLPGKVISKLGAPSVKLGEKLLEQAPNMGKWSKIAANTLNQTVGSATGFGLYNFITAEGGMEERSAALVHGLINGAAIHVFSAAGQAAERGILSKLTSSAERRAFSGMRDDIALGKYGDAVRRFDAALVGSAIEATGFAGLDRQFWADAMAGANGDQEASKRAMETWAGSLAAVLLARTGRPDIAQSFRRDAPDLNTLQTRLIAEDIRSKQQEPRPPQEPKVPPKLLGDSTVPREPMQAQAGMQAADEAAYRLPALQKASDPLFKSGWDMKPGVDVKDGVNTITMQFPGAGEIRMWENETQAGPAVEGFGLEVPVSVFRTVRGDVEIPDGTENIRMVGKVAEEFSRDLAAVSMLRRIRGEIMFGHNGEAWAGGPWRGEDGQYHTIGLDGQHYTQGLFPEDGYQLGEDASLPIRDNGAAQDPQIARWMELASSLRQNTADNPGLDLIEASVMLATRGDPNSRSVHEIQRLLGEEWQPGSGVMNADLAAAALMPDTIEQFGLTLGQVAAGHLTAEQAALQLQTTLMGSKKGTELQAPKEEPTGTVAGEADWFSMPPQDRRDAARAYVKQNPEATAPMLRDTFGVPRETARDILGETDRSGEAGFVDVAEPIRALGEFATKVVDVASGAATNLIESQTRQLSRRGGEPGQRLSEKMREAMSRQRAILGAAGSKNK